MGHDTPHSDSSPELSSDAMTAADGRPPAGLSRRTVALAGAWAVPAITLAVAAPAAAASPEVDAITVIFDQTVFDIPAGGTISNLGLLVQKITRASSPAAGASVSLEISEIATGTVLPPELEDIPLGEDVGVGALSATFPGGGLTATSVTDGTGRATAPVITAGTSYGVLQISASVTLGTKTATSVAFIRVQVNSGQLWSFGSPNLGALGNGNEFFQPVPALVTYSGNDIISMGSSRVGGAPSFINAAGDIYAWGWGTWGLNGQGNLGNTNSYWTPKYVYSPRKYKSVCVGGQRRNGAVSVDGGAYGWGYGQTATPTLMHPSLATGVKKLAIGEKHFLVLKTDGTVWAWGDNTNFALGIGLERSRRQATTGILADPLQLDFPAGAGRIIDIAAGAQNGYALDDLGNLYGWGHTFQTALGANAATYPPGADIYYRANAGPSTLFEGYDAPRRLNPIGDDGYTAIHFHCDIAYVFLAQKSDGTARMLAREWYDESVFGKGLIDVGLTGISRMALAAGTMYAVRTDGTLWAKGAGDLGQIGDGNSSFRATWTKAALPRTAKARSVHVGDQTAFVITNVV